MKRALTLAIGLLGLVVTHAFHIELHGVVTDYFTGDPLREVQIRMVKDGIERETVLTKKDGKYAFVLDRGYTYLIWFYKTGMVSKHVKIDATAIPPLPDVPLYDMDLHITLFEWIEGVDFSIFEQPIGLAEYVHSVRKLTWDVEYTKALRPKVDAAMIQYERRLGTLSARKRKGDEDRTNVPEQ
jgi:hypothetical protein